MKILLRALIQYLVLGCVVVYYSVKVYCSYIWHDHVILIIVPTNKHKKKCFDRTPICRLCVGLVGVFNRGKKPMKAKKEGRKERKKDRGYCTLQRQLLYRQGPLIN